MRVVTCIGCAQAITWLEHALLKCAVDCPACGAALQFGPGVYVETFRGYTPLEAAEQQARKVGRKYNLTKDLS